jgi:hypothetical protein
MRAVALKLFDDRKQVADRAGEAVQPDHDQGLAGADLAQQTGQHRAAAIGPGSVLLVHDVATGSAQLVKLWIGALLLG